MKIDQDSAKVKLPPPLVALAAILIGELLTWILPVAIIPEGLRFPLGLLFVVGGIALFLYCATRFKKAGTGIPPWTTTTKIITSGVYQYSRNPIYVAFGMVVLGIAFAVNSLWMALMLVPFVIIINKTAIEKEEKYLEEKFKEEYLTYKQKVRRWL